MDECVVTQDEINAITRKRLNRQAERLKRLEAAVFGPNAPTPDGPREGIVIQDDKDHEFADNDVNSDTNALFAVCRSLTLTRCLFRLRPGTGPNQYAARLSLSGALNANHCVFDNDAVDEAEAEACFRLIGCNGGEMLDCDFDGNRRLFGCGATDEAVDPQPCINLTIRGGTAKITSTSPDVDRIGGKTTGLKFIGHRWIIPDHKRIAAIEDGAEVEYIGCLRSPDGVNWRPLHKSAEDFKQPDHAGLKVSP